MSKITEYSRPTPSPLNSPFTREELELIKFLASHDVSSMSNNVKNTCNTLLSTPLHFPSEMEVWNDDKQFADVRIINGMYNGQYVVKVMEQSFITYKHARPIPPKQKTLSDLVKGDKVWAIDVCLVDENKTEALCFGKEYIVNSVEDIFVYFETHLKGWHRFRKDELHKFFQLTPPTPQQIEAAEQAEIDAVKQRFEILRKEVGK